MTCLEPSYIQTYQQWSSLSVEQNTGELFTLRYITRDLLPQSSCIQERSHIDPQQRIYNRPEYCVFIHGVHMECLNHGVRIANYIL
jgi:hypothetical protein